MRVLELYSGIGGMHYALIASGVPGEVVASMDINNIANEVYKYNFPEIENTSRNIESLSVEDITKMDIDTILMSPPCQPFTRVGLQMDVNDKRSLSLLHILTLIPKVKSLKHILLENVKGFEKSVAREILVACLAESGFNYKELILSPCQFGIPNTRRRYYLLAKRNNVKFCFTDGTLSDSLPAEIMYHMSPSNVHGQSTKEGEEKVTDETQRNECYRLEGIIEKDYESKTDSTFQRQIAKRTSVMDIRTPESRGSCCFTKAYGRYIEGTGSILSSLPQELANEKIRQLERLREGDNNFSQLLKDLKLRFFTPKEVSRLMCFPETFNFPNSITDKQRYRLLGNSLNVHVVSRLIYLLNHDGHFSTNPQSYNL